ncbi:hypothetical protein [Halomicrobium zhouii]|nr:hypothetical protein [Halomicrobium zhouii]
MMKLVIGLVILIAPLAGCTGPTEPPSSPATENATTPSPATSPTPTEDRRVTSTPTSTPELTQKEKYDTFRTGYVEGVENNGVNVLETRIHSANSTLYLKYEMKNPKSDLYTGRERENISLGYVVGVERFISKNNSEVNQSWVPKRVNVVAITPAGEIYETAYTTYDRAMKMITGDVSERKYLLKYYDTIEPGPANPDYED